MTAIAKPRREDRRKHAIDWRGFKFPRPTTERDRKYARDAVRLRTCRIRGLKKHVCGPKLDTHKVLLDFAHVPTDGHRALSKKASERGGGIVLCRFAHVEQHAIGWLRFAAKYGIDPVAEAKQLQHDVERFER